MTRPNNRRQRFTPPGGNYDEVIREMANTRQPWRQVSQNPPVLGGQVTAHAEALERARTSARSAGVNLDSPTQWWLLLCEGRIVVNFDIMSHEMLYREIDAAINDVIRLFQVHAEGSWLYTANMPIGLTAKRWLAVQPAFRALVQEAIRKQVALSDIAYLYVKQYMMVVDGQTGNVARPQPWADTSRLENQKDLREFSTHSVVVTTEETMVDKFGRRGRAIDLEDG